MHTYTETHIQVYTLSVNNLHAMYYVHTYWWVALAAESGALERQIPGQEGASGGQSGTS